VPFFFSFFAVGKSAPACLLKLLALKNLFPAVPRSRCRAIVSRGTLSRDSGDVNGNMITDLDRNIVTIKYNLLNLPELIQFGNGRQMKNTYTANGQKLRTEYFTPIVSVAVPVGSTTDLSAANRRKTEINYIGNKEYEIDHWGYHSLKRLHNSEGYIDFEVGDNSFYFDPRYNYYRCDHLGNTREVWQAPYLVHYRMTATMWGQEEIPQSPRWRGIPIPCQYRLCRHRFGNLRQRGDYHGKKD